MNVKDMTTKVLNYTQGLIDKHGPRPAGSQASQDCAHDLFDEMSTFADSTIIDDFKVHTGAFLGWIRIEVVLYVVGIALLWAKLAWVAAVLLFIGILIMVFQFFLYKHTIDFLFKKREGHNVTGILEPEGEVKQQIIISGHHDSAPVFNFFIHQPGLYALRINGGIGALIGICVLSAITAIVGSPAWLNITVAVLASLGTVFVLQLWFFASKQYTPGAGDNLVASAMGVEVLRAFADQAKKSKGLKHTRVLAVSFDGEEAGLRGAHAYAKTHANTLQAVPTYLYNIDCPYYKKDIFFLTSDINGSVSLSEELAGECQTVAANLGIKAKVKSIAFLTGGTDAGELAKIGVDATTLMAMPWDNNERASVYHTPDDTVDKVEPKAVEAALDIFINLVQKKDKDVS